MEGGQCPGSEKLVWQSCHLKLQRYGATALRRYDVAQQRTGDRLARTAAHGVIFGHHRQSAEAPASIDYRGFLPRLQCRYVQDAHAHAQVVAMQCLCDLKDALRRTSA